MSMELNIDSNGTCTMLVLNGFNYTIDDGESETGGPNNVCVIPEVRDNGGQYTSLTEFIIALQHLVVQYDYEDGDYTYSGHNVFTDRQGEYNYPVADLALVSATTSSEQVDAEKWLAQLGFKIAGIFPSVKYDGRSNRDKGYGNSLRHTKSVVTLWTMPAPDFFNLLFPKGYLGPPANAAKLVASLTGEKVDSSFKEASKKLLRAAKRSHSPF